MRDFNEVRVFVDHMRIEHSHLDSAVQKIEADLHEKPDSAQVRGALVQLRDTVARHFDEEEAGGCLEEAACRCPSLAHDVTLIEREHPEMLKRLDQLIARATQGCDGNSNVGFVESFARFATTLRAHEAAETRILEQAFGTAIVDVDVN